jgi:hypothetical protein
VIVSEREFDGLPQYRSEKNEFFPGETRVEYHWVCPWEIVAELNRDISGSLKELSPGVTMYPFFSSTIFADTDGTAIAAPRTNNSANQ